MTAKAKLFMHGRSQAVRLPKGFRLLGKEVRVTRVGHKIVLEPLEPLEPPAIDFEGWWKHLDALGAKDFLAGKVPDDPPVKPDDTIDFR